MKKLMQPVLEPILDFGTCLKRILESRRISASELARMMAYKSRNSIFRILDEEGGEMARQAFYDRLTTEDPLQLTQEERKALFQALEVSRVGKRTFLSNYAMRELLLNAGGETDMPRVRIDAFRNKDDPNFHNALAAIAKGKKAYITITGCCDRAIFEALRERIYKTDVTCEVRVTHLIYTGEEEIVQNISAIQPLLYCDFYKAYCVQPGVFSKEREAVYRQNYIYVYMQDMQNIWYNQVFMLVDKGVFVPLAKVRVEQSRPFSAFFSSDVASMPLLKAEFSDGGEMKSYLDYTRSCRKLEMNRAIYTIKLDVSINCIHPEILLPCITDEFRQGEDAQRMIDELWRVHLDRWENLFGKKKASHIIFSKEAMLRFAKTGRQSDHFFAFRAYTPKERVAILENLLRQEQENPNFHIYFFKEDFDLPLTEIGLYEGIGTLMTKPYTHYNLAGDHAETIITQKEFCERYKEFYVEDLLKRHVVSAQETLEYMNKLIEIAKEQ